MRGYLAPILFGLASLAGLVATLSMPEADAGSLSAWRATAAASSLTPVWLLAIFVTCGLVVLPITAVVLATGLLYGKTGFFLAYAGMMLAALAGFGAGRWFDNRRPEGEETSKAAAALAARVRRNAFAASLFARWIPGLPFALQNTTFGAIRTPFFPFLGGSLIGVAGTTGFFIIAGIAGGDLIHRLEESLRFGWTLPAAGLAASLLWMSVLAVRNRKVAAAAVLPRKEEEPESVIR